MFSRGKEMRNWFSLEDNNVMPSKHDSTKWDAADPAGSVLAVCERIEAHAEGVIYWYLKAKRAKRLMARGGALVLGGIAGLLPIFAQLKTFDLLKAEPAWASVLLGLAAILVLLDRFFGFSTSWMRFITTEHQVRQALHEFQIESDSDQAAWADGKPNMDQVQQTLQRCKVFMVTVDDLVRAETDRWVAEFQDAIKDVDELARARATLLKSGAINVTVTNGDAVVGGWKLAVDNVTVGTYTGKQAAAAPLSTGLHTVCVMGTVDGEQRRAEIAASVAADNATDITLTI